MHIKKGCVTIKDSEVYGRKDRAKMSSQDWERFGEEIRDTVQDAVENQNYERLNQMISDTVNRAVNTVAKGVSNATQTKYRGYKTYTVEYEHSREGDNTKRKVSGIQYTNQKQETRPATVTFETKAPSSVGPILCTSLGYTFGFVMLILFIVFFVVGNVVTAGVSAGFHVGAVFFGALSAGCITLGAWGTKGLLRIKRFKEYVKAIGKKEYCNISELAARVRKSDKFVLKDVEGMVKNRWFCHGHLDKQKTCLMVTDQIYTQYCQLEQQKMLEQKEAEQKALLQKEQQKAQNSLSPEVQKVLHQGDEYIQKIRACNDAISGEEISEKIRRIEMLVDRIFDRVEQNPKSVSDIRKLMDYYLPTTVKLLDAYAEMDAQPAGGENIQSSKMEIEATLDTLNIAFEKLLDSLFQETAWDVSSDISVLNTMLAQEGLKEDGLKK